MEGVHSLKIFDRWGGLVFESFEFRPGGSSAGWDGFFKGKKANPGVYIWLAEVEFRDVFEERMRGGVTPLR